MLRRIMPAIAGGRRSRQKPFVKVSVTTTLKFWWSFEPVKFLKWVESVDHFTVPIAVDIGLAVFAAGLVTAILRYILEMAA
jgi:hypothetical protein